MRWPLRKRGRLAGHGVTVGSFRTYDGRRMVQIRFGSDDGAAVPPEAARILAVQLNAWADYADKHNSDEGLSDLVQRWVVTLADKAKDQAGPWRVAGDELSTPKPEPQP